MPIVAEFGAYKIAMYFHDHNPPHVHVFAADFEGLVSIVDGGILAGSIPPKYRRDALDWVREHRMDLLAKWQEYH